jgi:RHS repeat-associated protein
MVDAMGRTAFTRTDSGINGGTLTPNKQISYQYDALGDTTQVTTTDEQPQSGESTASVTVTMSYDDLGRLTQVADPDLGTHNYSYDADGHLTEDSSSGRTLGYNYDLLGRLGCEETAAPTANATGTCSAGTPLLQNTYDVSAPGVTWQQTDYPIGRLTQSVSTTIYPDSTQTSSTESVQYDQRGRTQTQQLALSLPSSWGVTTALPAYQLSQTYTDANQPESTQTSTIANGTSTPGYTFTQDYDSTTGTLVGLSGNLLYSANGTMGTARGYTGQYSDPLTRLDYYVSRYYDPVAGIFLSADTKQGNVQGMNPYTYMS